jgi:hypothetical protein
MEFGEKDNLLSYFAAKADIEPTWDPSLDFFYSIQLDPLC